MDREVHREYLGILRQTVADCEGRDAEAAHQIGEIRNEADRRIEALERDRSVWRDEAERCRRLIPAVAALAGEDAETEPGQKGERSSPPEPARPSANGMDASVAPLVRHADVAEIVLRNAGRPMKVAEIIAVMREMGHHLPENKVNQFNAIYSAMLRRPHVFENRGREGWALVTPPDVRRDPTQDDFAGMTKAQAARVALERIGRPATAAEIRDELLRLGYVMNPDRKIASNIIYNSVGRRKDVFRLIDGGQWELIAPSEGNLR